MKYLVFFKILIIINRAIVCKKEEFQFNISCIEKISFVVLCLYGNITPNSNDIVFVYSK